MERQIKIDLFATIDERLSTASKIAVLCHAYGDGDCYGSALALQSAINRVYGHKITCCTLVSQEAVGSKYSFMPGVDSIRIWPEGQDKYDIVVTVDTASTQLLCDRVQLLDGAYVISFDHHSSFTSYADIDVREPHYGACAELVYEFICHIAGEPTAEEAVCLYTAISSDTGGLSQKNTTSNSMMVSAKLCEYDSVKVDDISFRLFKSSSYARNQVIGHCLSNEKQYVGGKICTSYITRQLLDETGCTDSETDGIVSLVFATEGCEIAILTKETLDGPTKCSLRSKDIDVAQVAAHFGGGGHVNAAGCRVDADAETAAHIVAKYIMENGLI